MPRPASDPYLPNVEYVVPNMGDDPTRLIRHYQGVKQRMDRAIAELVASEPLATSDRLKSALAALAVAQQHVELAQRLTAEFALSGKHLTQREVANALNGTTEGGAPLNSFGHSSIGRWFRDPITAANLDAIERR